MMKRVKLAKGISLVSLAALSFSLVGCAEDVGTLDRTRPDKIKKSIFQTNDEWYFLETVVDADMAGSRPAGMGVGLVMMGSLKRIRWEITESALLALSTVEPAINSTQNEQPADTRRLGVVAAYPITSHFDVQRSYNSSTGQLTNVISENSSDRDWTDREYMRVAWERDAVDGVRTFGARAGRAVPMARTVSESERRFDYDRPTVTEDYVDSVSRYLFQPDVYACYNNYGFDGIHNCESGAISIRRSFMKLPKKQTYQPLKYADIETLADAEGNMVHAYSGYSNSAGGSFTLNCDPEIVSLLQKQYKQSPIDACEPLTYGLGERFGFFRQNRSIADKHYPQFNEQRVYMANRWNIWQTAYNDDGTVIPLNERKPKQIVYYTNAGYPERLWEVAEEVSREWNRVFTNAVKNARYVTTCDADGVLKFYEQYINIRDRNVTYYVDATGTDPASSDLSFASDPVLSGLLYLAEQSLDNRSQIDDAYVAEYGTSKGQAPLGLKAVCGLLGNSLNGEYSTKTLTSALATPAQLKTDIKAVWDGLGLPPSVASGNCDVANVSEWLKNYFKAKEVVWQLVATEEANAGVTPFSIAGKLVPNETWYHSKDTIQDIVNQLAQDELNRSVNASGGLDKLQTECDGIKDKVKDSPVVTKTTSISNQVYLNQIKSVWNRLSITFDDKSLSGIRKLIAENNNGDEHMYTIKRNSCSGVEIEAWFQNNRGLNEEVDAIEKRLSEGTSIRATVEGLSREELKRTCAELEYVTADVEDETKRFTWQRLGDIRYSFFTYIDQAVDGWAGYGPTAADPITGEAIHASANFAGQYLEFYAPRVATDLLYFQGKLPESELIWGDYIFKYLRKQSHMASAVEGEKRGFLDLSDAKNNFEMPIAGVNKENLTLGRKNSYDRYEKVPEKILALGTRKLSTLEKIAMDKNFALQANKQKRIEKFFEDPQARQMLEQSEDYLDSLNAFKETFRFANPTLEEEQIDKLANRYMLFPNAEMERQRAISHKASENNMLLNSDLESMLAATTSLVGASEYFKDKSREEIEKFLFRTIMAGTQLHEVGHTMGLRHNFFASTDTMNYSQEYWDMMAVVKQHAEIIKNNNWTPEEARAKGFITEDDLWYIPKDKAEQLLGYKIDLPYFDQSIYRGSSVMDYYPGALSRAASLGRYDEAAINFAYANKIETLPASAKITGSAAFFQNYYFNYRDLPALYIGKMDNTATKISAAEYQIGVKNMTRNRTLIDVEDAKKDYLSTIIKNTEAFKKGGSFLSVDTVQLDRSIPYKYCSDEVADRLLNCYRQDWGATVGEILQTSFDTYRIMRNKWRYLGGKKYDNYQNLRSYVNRIAYILFNAQRPFYYFSIYGYREGLGNFASDLRDAAIGSFNFMHEMFAQPEPGYYCYVDDPNQLVTLPIALPFHDMLDTYVSARYINTPFDRTNGKPTPNCKNMITIGRDVGAFYSNGFTQEKYGYRVQRVGAYFEKSLSLQSFFNIAGDYARIDQIQDSRAGVTSFWTQFGDQVYHWTRGLILNDYKEFGGIINSQGLYEPPLSIDPFTYRNGGKNRQADYKRVLTNAGYDHSFRALVYSLINNNTFQDYRPDFIQFMKVCSSPSECEMSESNWENGFDGRLPVVFEHPFLPMEFRAFVPGDGKSIAKDIIDRLNEIKPLYVDWRNRLDAAVPGTQDWETAKNLTDILEQLMEAQINKINQIRFIMKRLDGSY